MRWAASFPPEHPGTRQPPAASTAATPWAVLSALASLPCCMSESMYEPSASSSTTAKQAIPTMETVSIRERPWVLVRGVMVK